MNCPICFSASLQNPFTSRRAQLARYGFCRTINEAKEKNLNLSMNIFECHSCGYAWNIDYCPSDINYSSLPVYESSSHSSRYQNFQIERAAYLSTTLRLDSKESLEIGGGNGFFTSKLSSNNKLIYEPSKEALTANYKNIEIINDYFNPLTHQVKSDLIIMRQVLEHIPEPEKFLGSLINNIRINRPTSETYLYIEVPSYDQTKSYARYYDFYYEHCNYFSAASLACLAKKLSIRLVFIESVYEDEILSCLLQIVPNNNTQDDFSISEKIIDLIHHRAARSDEIVLWGASGNGIAFLNYNNILTDQINYVIDSDPRKQNLYVPYTGQLIVSPESSLLNSAKIFIVATQFHCLEIADTCRAKFGDKVLIYNLNGELL